MKEGEEVSRKARGVYRPTQVSLSRMTNSEYKSHRNSHPPLRKRRSKQNYESLGRMTPSEFTHFIYRDDPLIYGIHAKNYYGEK